MRKTCLSKYSNRRNVHLPVFQVCQLFFSAFITWSYLSYFYSTFAFSTYIILSRSNNIFSILVLHHFEAWPSLHTCVIFSRCALFIVVTSVKLITSLLQRWHATNMFLLYYELVLYQLLNLIRIYKYIKIRTFKQFYDKKHTLWPTPNPQKVT